MILLWPLHYTKVNCSKCTISLVRARKRLVVFILNKNSERIKSDTSE